MAKLSGKQIQHLARQLIAGKPDGIRYCDLVEEIARTDPETPRNTIHGAVWDLHKQYPKEITKPKRGLFVPAKAQDQTVQQTEVATTNLREEDFNTGSARKGALAKLNRKQIQDLAKEIIVASPGGIRYTSLVNEIARRSPGTPRNTIVGNVWDLHTQYPKEITKPSRGLFVAASAQAQPPQQTGIETAKAKEEDFYAPFAEYLKGDLDEATEAVAMGGSVTRTKWGTPDIIGVYRPRAAELIKFTPEIISGEVKIDSQHAVVAFGQAIAYRLFSAKIYIAMPSSLSQEDSARLEALCLLFGVGLVVFKPDPKAPDFQIRVRAQRFSPDMYYVNEFAEPLRQGCTQIFEKLFG